MAKEYGHVQREILHFSQLGKEYGHVQFKIEHFSQFVKSKCGNWRQSEAVIIRQLPWIIKTRHREPNFGGKGWLECHIVCARQSSDSGWSCLADVILRVQAQKQTKLRWLADQWGARSIRTFTAKDNYFGFNNILVEDLMKPQNGWYDPDNDTILVKADIWAEAPIGLKNRMKNLLSTGMKTDVHFLVGTGCGKQKFSVHKLILTTASDVFERMFQFDADNGNGDRVIEIPDVTPLAFQVLLNYIYEDELDGLNLNQDNVFDVIYAAKKYNIASLINKCVNWIKLSSDNVLIVLIEARLYDLKDLIERCWNFIDQNAYAVFATDEFLQIDQKLLVELFGRDQLKLHNSDEIAIWHAANRWADAQCRKRNMEVTGDHGREILGPALHKIRFPLISKDQFANIIVPSKMFTSDELINVFFYRILPTTDGIPVEFSRKSRAC